MRKSQIAGREMDFFYHVESRLVSQFGRDREKMLPPLEKKDLPELQSFCMVLSCMAEVAQLAEHLVVAQRAESSSLFFRPILLISP